MARFQKGHIPWQKGKPLTDEHKQKLADHYTPEKKEKLYTERGYVTKKGKPLFSERITKDGYIEIKVRNDGGSRGKNWRPKHLWIYEQHHNVTVDVRKELVIFLDQNKRNFDIDNLMLIPRKLISTINHIGLTNNAEENKVKITMAMLKQKQLDRGEELGLVKKYPSGHRVPKSYQKEKAKEYREKKKSEKE